MFSALFWCSSDSSALFLCCVSCGKLLCVSQKMAPLVGGFILAGGMQRPEPEYSQFLLWCDSSMGEECVGGQGVGEWILSSTWFMEVSCRLGWGGSVIHTVRHTAVQGGQKNGWLCPAHYLLYSLQCWQTSSVRAVAFASEFMVWWLLTLLVHRRSRVLSLWAGPLLIFNAPFTGSHTRYPAHQYNSRKITLIK